MLAGGSRGGFSASLAEEGPGVAHRAPRWGLNGRVRSIKRKFRRGRRKAGAAGKGGRVMTLEMLVMWVVVGLVAGWLAGIVMKGGG